MSSFFVGHWFNFKQGFISQLFLDIHPPICRITDTCNISRLEFPTYFFPWSKRLVHEKYYSQCVFKPTTFRTWVFTTLPCGVHQNVFVLMCFIQWKRFFGTTHHSYIIIGIKTLSSDHVKIIIIKNQFSLPKQKRQYVALVCLKNEMSEISLNENNLLEYSLILKTL